MPKKPIKEGIKLFSVAEATSGYVLYARIAAPGEFSLPPNVDDDSEDHGDIHRVVMHLMEKANLLDQGFHLYTDRDNDAFLCFSYNVLIYAYNNILMKLLLLSIILLVFLIAHCPQLLYQ